MDDPVNREAELLEMQNQRGAMHIVCSRCNRSFAFTVKEQAFFAEKGFNKPKKCKTCKKVVNVRD